MTHTDITILIAIAGVFAGIVAASCLLIVNLLARIAAILLQIETGLKQRPSPARYYDSRGTWDNV